MYRFLRVFCATAWEMEGERRAFHDVLGEFNETVAMQHGILYVPVSLTNTPDKRPYQYTIDENIRDSRHYLLVVTEDWGPKERNFERDYRLALASQADPALPMKATAILLARMPDGSVPSFGASLELAGFAFTPFANTDEFRVMARQLFSDWFTDDRESSGVSGPA